MNVCTQYLRKRIVSTAVVWFIQRKHDKLRDERNSMLKTKLVNFNNIMIIYYVPSVNSTIRHRTL